MFNKLSKSEILSLPTGDISKILEDFVEAEPGLFIINSESLLKKYKRHDIWCVGALPFKSYAMQSVQDEDKHHTEYEVIYALSNDYNKVKDYVKIKLGIGVAYAIGNIFFSEETLNNEFPLIPTYYW